MTSSPISSSPTDPWQKLTGLCDLLVLHAPKTWGDLSYASRMEMPQGLDATVSYIRNNLVDRLWRNHLILLTAVLYSQNLQYKTVMQYLCRLHPSFDRLFAALGLSSMTQWNADEYLTQYLSSQVLVQDSAQLRIAFWHFYQAGSRHLKRWITNLPLEEQEKYRPFVLPYPADPHELTRLCNARKTHYERQEKRKEETDAIMPFYAQLRTHAHLRYNLLTRLRKAYRKAIKAVEDGKLPLPFEFEMREGSDGREPCQPTERLLFKLWDRRSFVLEHTKEHPHLFSRITVRDAKKGKDSFSPAKNSYFLEFVRAEPLGETGPVVGLWFQELLERNVLGTLSGSPEEMEKKQQWLQAQGYVEEEKKKGISAPFRAPTPGILTPTLTSGDGHFFGRVRERTGALLISVEPLWTAATFGMVSLHILTANGMRIGELLQLKASPDGILPLTIPPSPDATDQTPQVHWAVRAIPKGKRVPATYYLDDEHLRLLALVKHMLCEHYQIDPKSREGLPSVPMRGNNKHRLQPEQYLFQYNHECLFEDDLRASLRFLMHGLVFQTLDQRRVTIRPHLLRHGFATWALNVAKEPVDIVARILNQSNLDITKFYGRPNPRLIAERSHGLMHQISSYIDLGDLVQRSPEELRELLKKAQKTHGTLARTRGGRCLLCGECPILFACIGCSAKVPDPAQRDEIEEVQQITLLQIERAKKKGLALEVAQHQKKLKQCEAELREMDMIEACRADELREPEVNFDVEA